MESARRVAEWWLAAGEEFRGSLSDADGRLVSLAKDLFLISLFAPLILYYVAGPDAGIPRFPVTISWTIRKGPPKWIQHAVWLSGWAVLLFLHFKTGDAVGFTFALQFVFVGIQALVVHPVGVNWRVSKVHHQASAVYILDHIAFLSYYNVQPLYRRVFWFSLVAFFALTALLRLLTSDLELDDRNWAQMRYQRLCLEPGKRRQILVVEFLEMVFEYALIVAFVDGVDSHWAAA